MTPEQKFVLTRYAEELAALFKARVETICDAYATVVLPDGTYRQLAGPSRLGWTARNEIIIANVRRLLARDVAS